MVRELYFRILIDQSILLEIIHVYVRSDGLAAAVISDNEYPKEVAENLLIKVRLSMFFFLLLLYG
jgi:hypothetical protein